MRVEKKEMVRLTAKEAAERLGISYVVASGLMTYLEDVGKAKVVEKKFHSSGKGKPTRVYEVEDSVAIDFAVEEPVAVESVEEPVAVESVEEPVAVESVEEPVAVESVEEPVAVEEGKIETLDHVAAALARLKSESEEAA